MNSTTILSLVPILLPWPVEKRDELERAVGNEGKAVEDMKMVGSVLTCSKKSS